MDNLLAAMNDAGEVLAGTMAQTATPTGSRTRYGTVVKNNGATLDVELFGATLTGVPMLTTRAGAQVGDRCILTVDGPLVTVTGIIATADNVRYVNIQSWESGALHAQRIGRYATCMVRGNITAPSSWGQVTVGTIPEAYRPARFWETAFVVQNSGAACGVMQVSEGGQVYLIGKGNVGGYGASDWVFASISYPVA